MSKNTISSELLQRYLEGRCNAEEVEQVEAWYASLNETEADAYAFNQRQHLKKVQDLIQHKTAVNQQPIGKVRSLMPTLIRYAAAAMIAIVLGVTGIKFLKNQPPARRGLPEQVSITNTQKRVIRYQLPDRSLVWLNPEAKLRYTTASFSHATREVILEGEAFFDVTRDATRPFLVKTHTLLVKVLGTSFNVKATPDQSRYEVSVVTGNVSVSVPDRKGQGKAMLVFPHQQAVFDAASDQLTATKLPILQEQVNAWQPVTLSFDDERLDEVMKRLETKFGVTIRLANPNLANCHLKVAFENNRLAEILEIATQMVDASYQMQGNRIVVSGEGCSNVE